MILQFNENKDQYLSYMYLCTGSSCFHVSTSVATYSEAIDACVSLSAVLATILDSDQVKDR